MPRSAKRRKDPRVHVSSFGACTALLFHDSAGSAEIALAPLEISRLLRVWEEAESAKKTPDQRVLSALELLIPKARTSAPAIVAEVPIARSNRAALIPDLEYEQSFQG